MIYIGIDPGATGALVALFKDGKRPIVWTAPMPPTMPEILKWLKRCNHLGKEVHAVVERVGGYIRGIDSPGAAMFNFGKGYGSLLMALCAAGVPHEEVNANVWQAGLGISPRKKNTKSRVKINSKGRKVVEKYGGESTKDWKNRLKAKAQQLFPREKVTLVTADALLIAEYCRRKMTGTLEK